GQHVTDCEDRDTCRGCLPRDAEYGHLCETCHLRLSASLADVPTQLGYLREMVEPSQQAHVRPQPKHGRPDYWPVESNAPRYFYVTGNDTFAPQEGEPIRLACLDADVAISDLLTEWVEWVCERYGRTGPTYATTAAEDQGREHWSGPRPTLAGETAARWLRANLEWLERLEFIGDMMEDLRMVMGQAHALAPWREMSKRIKGIVCPECHRHTLVQFGGRDTVTCQNQQCKVEIPQQRYLIWARMYEQEAG
ncbi:MAG: hypothetical protein Q4F67_16855, partial [Propionibacteriaceae bacterium]|nr:hypothetical protein [Propionibacteriaceae bacterium]